MCIRSKHTPCNTVATVWHRPFHTVEFPPWLAEYSWAVLYCQGTSYRERAHNFAFENVLNLTTGIWEKWNDLFRTCYSILKNANGIVSKSSCQTKLHYGLFQVIAFCIHSNIQSDLSSNLKLYINCLYMCMINMIFNYLTASSFDRYGDIFIYVSYNYS
jgi:hypothetical protein